MNGGFAWRGGARLAGTGTTDVGQGVSVDTLTGNVYVGFRYNSNPLTVYNAGGIAFGTTLALIGTGNSGVAQYDPNGNVNWVARIAGTSTGATPQQILNGIAVDSADGSFAVTGQYTSNPLSVYHSNGNLFSNLALVTSSDIFTINYDIRGLAQWAARMSGTGNSDIGEGVAVDSSTGQIYVVGQSNSNPLSIYNSSNVLVSSLALVGVQNDILMVKYGVDGSVLGAVRAGGTLSDVGNAVAVHPSARGVYITGTYSSTTLTTYNASNVAFATTLGNAGNSDACIIKYNK